MKLYRLTDRIKIKIKDLTIYISPLSLEQKAEINKELLSFSENKDLLHLTNATILAMRYGIKKIDGLEGYTPNFEEGTGYLSTECISDLSNSEISREISTSCLAFLNGIPKEILDEANVPLEGVEILPLD